MDANAIEWYCVLACDAVRVAVVVYKSKISKYNS